MADATVHSTAASPFGYTIDAADFTLHSGYTGDDTEDKIGPGPFYYLATSLGTCTSINVQGFARKRTLPLEALDVTVSIRRTTDRDAAGEQHWDVTTELALHGPLSDEQRQALLHAAEHCSVRTFFLGRQTVTERLVEPVATREQAAVEA